MLPVLSAGESEVEIDLILELWSSHEGGNTNFWKSFISNFSPIWPLVPEILRFFSGGKNGGFGGNVRWVGHDSFLALGKGSFHGHCRGLCAGLAWDPDVGIAGLVCWWVGGRNRLDSRALVQPWRWQHKFLQVIYFKFQPNLATGSKDIKIFFRR